eukprot:3721191-Pleurochrysis_carterae.AAC.2
MDTDLDHARLAWRVQANLIPYWIYLEFLPSGAGWEVIISGSSQGQGGSGMAVFVETEYY